MKKVRFHSAEKATEEVDPCNQEFCCHFTYKGASTVVILVEGLYCIFYLLVLIFAIVKYYRARSIFLLSVNLYLLLLQILVTAIGLWKEKPRLLQTHLIFLCLTMVWDLIMTTGFFILAVYPKAKDHDFIGYKGSEFNARVFGIVMGSTMAIFFALRILSTWVIWKYRKLLLERERRPFNVKYLLVPTKASLKHDGNSAPDTWNISQKMSLGEKFCSQAPAFRLLHEADLFKYSRTSDISDEPSNLTTTSYVNVL